MVFPFKRSHDRETTLIPAEYERNGSNTLAVCEEIPLDRWIIRQQPGHIDGELRLTNEIKFHYYQRSAGCVATFNSLGADKFEWRRQLSETSYSSLHISCRARSWYHGCVDEVLELIKEYDPQTLIGASMGGYAALLFSSLTGVKARAFGPQTTLLDVPWDRRWQYEWGPIRKLTKRPDLLDLAKLQHNRLTEIYYCAPVTEDKLHAENLRGKVEIHPRGCQEHHQAADNLHLGVYE